MRWCQVHYSARSLCSISISKVLAANRSKVHTYESKLAHWKARANEHAVLQEGAEDAKGVPKVGNRQPQRFVPFTQGARDCVGQTLARLNLSTTLAQLFGSFSFRLAEEVRSLFTCNPYFLLLFVRSIRMSCKGLPWL